MLDEILTLARQIKADGDLAQIKRIAGDIVRADAATFKESDHPRAEEGKFGSGGGGVTFGEHNPPKILGGAFPEIQGVERRPNPSVVAVTNDLTMRTLPDGKFQADYSPQW